MKILTIVGARPQFIKAVALSREFSRRKNVNEKILHTGQHYDASMSRVFFRELGIPKPYRNLRVGSAPHGEQTASMLRGIEKECLAQRPDVLLIYGDTNSTVAGALAASKLGIPVAHVEAGLRSFNDHMPEEINRVISDRLSTWLFAPTKTAVQNLKREGIIQGVHRTGDVMVDTILLFSKISERILKNTRWPFDVHRPFFLLTLHRQENTDDPARLRHILEAMHESPFPVVFPIHPRTLHAVRRHRISLRSPVLPTPPMGYFEMIYLQKRAQAVWTDSGGVQKEACVLQRPCITLREETEWVETVIEGSNRLVGADANQIRKILKTASWRRMNRHFPFKKYYGSGKAAEKIANVLAGF